MLLVVYVKSAHHWSRHWERILSCWETHVWPGFYPSFAKSVVMDLCLCFVTITLQHSFPSCCLVLVHTTTVPHSDPLCWHFTNLISLSWVSVSLLLIKHHLQSQIGGGEWQSAASIVQIGRPNTLWHHFANLCLQCWPYHCFFRVGITFITTWKAHAGIWGSAAAGFQRVSLWLLTPVALGQLDLVWCTGTAKDMSKGWWTDRPGCTTYCGVKTCTATASKERVSHHIFFLPSVLLPLFFCCMYDCCRTGAVVIWIPLAGQQSCSRQHTGHTAWDGCLVLKDSRITRLQLLSDAGLSVVMTQGCLWELSGSSQRVTW